MLVYQSVNETIFPKWWFITNLVIYHGIVCVEKTLQQ